MSNIQYRFIYTSALLFLFFNSISAQYQFTGTVKNDSLYNSKVFLSLIDDYKSIYKISETNIIGQTEIDSLGNFTFKGNNLPEEKKFYQIHLADEEGYPFFSYEGLRGHNFILFIANNSDKIHVSLSDKMFFGLITSKTKYEANSLMLLDSIKHKIIGDLGSNYSNKNLELHNSNYFKTIKAYSQKFDDPLIKLAAINYLNHIDDSRQTLFLNDYKTNPDYYTSILNELKAKYPETLSTKNYEEDLEYASLRLDSNSIANYKTWIIILSVFSILLIVFIWYILTGNNKQNLKKKLVSKKNKELTKQELNILNLVQQGKSNKAISEELFISISTVKTHIHNIYGKLNITSRDELKHYK